jgi:hypothetical protein
MFTKQTVCNATQAVHALRLDQFKTLHGQRTHSAWIHLKRCTGSARTSLDPFNHIHYLQYLLIDDIEVYFVLQQVSQQVGMWL